MKPTYLWKWKRKAKKSSTLILYKDGKKIGSDSAIPIVNGNRRRTVRYCLLLVSIIVASAQTLTVSPSNVMFIGVEGGLSPKTQTLQLTTVPSMWQLNIFSKVTVLHGKTPIASWLNTIPVLTTDTSGSASVPIIVSLNGIPPGTYACSVDLSAPTSTTATIYVTLIVTSPSQWTAINPPFVLYPSGGVSMPIIGTGMSINMQSLINGQNRISASTWANQALDLLTQNIQIYFNHPYPRPSALQQAGLATFDQTWNSLVQQCSNPALGQAGKNCIADRQRGACTWKTSAGQCFDWFAAFRDPIANN